ncbi:MAG: hypothetical protein FWG07_12135 [Treponema sp.]|nr:hypothetical protein [Treponema sp.]
MKKYFPFLLIFVFFIVFPLEAEKLPPFVMPSARAAGFGGIHAAQGDDFSAIFSNPASFAGIEKQFSAAEITISLYGPVFELLDTAVNKSGDVSSVVNTESFAAGFDIGGPIALGLVNNGFGIGFFNRTVADVEAILLPAIPGTSEEQYILIPRAWEEFLLVGGYSFRVLDRESHKVDIGILGKAFYRIMLDIEMPVIDIADWNERDINIQPPLQTHFGMGIDLGIRYCYDDTLTLSLAGYDVYSPALVTKYDRFEDYGNNGTQSYGIVQPRLALGVLYRLRNDFLERYVSDIILMADYRDFISLFENDTRHPLLNFSLGMEITVLKILKLRAGMAELLPSGGFGIDMTFMTMDVAVRSKQLGDKPGEKTVFAMDVGLLFRY